MRTLIIVGAGPGVGLALARRFGREGFTVGLVSRNPEALTDRLRSEGVQAHWAKADAGNGEQLDDALRGLMDILGGCDVLIYNAAVLRSAGPLDLTTAQIEAEFAVNLLGAHRTARIVAPGMIRRKQGALLFTGGGLALEPFPEWTSLALGKAALRSLALSLYKQLAPLGVHVSVLAICGIVEPGGPFDPDRIADEYWRVATGHRGLADREVVIQPAGTDPLYNDPERKHRDTTVLPPHAGP